jgi:hypothetical protein
MPEDCTRSSMVHFFHGSCGASAVAASESMGFKAARGVDPSHWPLHDLAPGRRYVCVLGRYHDRSNRRAACATSIPKTWICATASSPPGRTPPPCHGFQRFEPPVVESFELLARKAGEEVAQQIYHFEDKSNRQLALRPEVTPSLVRMIARGRRRSCFPRSGGPSGNASATSA